MNRTRHLLRVVAASLPLLAILVLANLDHGASAVASVAAMWVVGVAVLARWVWRDTILPLADVAEELGASRARQAAWQVRELKEQAQACAEQRAELTQLVEDLSHGLGEGLLVIGPDLRVRLVNPRALHFFGVERFPEGSHLLDLLRVPDVVQVVRQAAAGLPTSRAMVENPRGLWEVRAFPMRQGGAVMLLTEVGLIRRGAELRRRFVQDLSHELRSPLAVMRTTVETLEGEINPKLAEMLVRQVERITRLTDELHELATIESGQVELRPERQDLGPLIAEVLNDFASVAESAGVELRAELPADLMCICDRRGLNRVLSNLVDNAIKYNRDGGWVQVRGWFGERAVHLEVADSGIGIPADELGAVMQRFYRIDRARTPGAGGLGLGLAIVKHMVQQMGGNLSIDSREGVGTKVMLTLPAEVQRRQAPAADTADSK